MTRFRRLGIARLVAGLGVFAMVAWVSASNQVSACESRPFAEAKVPGDPRLWLELALTAEQQTRGLMFRQTMPNDLGMLFVFGERTGGAFWMRNTLIPLSIAYIDSDGTILDMQDMQPQ